MLVPNDGEDEDTRLKKTSFGYNISFISKREKGNETKEGL